jgi:hypothetical protein
MNILSARQNRKILVVVKTYPSLSKKYGETVCTAGILLGDDEKPKGWIRIYPICFRQKEIDERFKKYTIISADIWQDSQDPRPESHKIDGDSIKILREITHSNDWFERNEYVLPFRCSSVSEIIEEGKSLGIIKPREIIKPYVETTEREWPDNKQVIKDQLNLFVPPSDLEKIPYRFGYEFIDGDGMQHRYSVADWEISQLYRNMRNKSLKPSREEKEKEAVEKVLEKLEWMRERDLHFIVGNQHRYPKVFMIVGLFFPPLVEYQQTSLMFDL